MIATYVLSEKLNLLIPQNYSSQLEKEIAEFEWQIGFKEEQAFYGLRVCPALTSGRPEFPFDFTGKIISNSMHKEVGFYVSEAVEVPDLRQEDLQEFLTQQSHMDPVLFAGKKSWGATEGSLFGIEFVNEYTTAASLYKLPANRDWNFYSL